MTTASARAQRVVMTPRGAILALLLVGVLFSSVYPIKRYFAVRTSIAQLQREDRSLDQRQQELEQRRVQLQTDAEVERIAREDLGMVRPGEVAFAVVQPSVQPSTPARVAPAGLLDPTQIPAPSFFSRIWSAVMRAAHTIR
ncbi:MAG: FtsB family cell division protein [Actinomycetota bacterium]